MQHKFQIMFRIIFKYTYLLLFAQFLLLSCKPESKNEVDVSDIKAEVKLLRFDQIFGEANEQTLPQIMATYPLLFPAGRTASDWLAYKNDTIFQELYQETQKVFGDFKKEKKELNNLFKHVKYYYPTFKEPEIITMVSNLDVENQVFYADSLLFIALDTYLGKSKIYYTDAPAYIQKNFEPNRISIDVATAIAYQTSPEIAYRMFVERIIAQGKMKYAVQQFLPELSEAAIMGYTDTHLEWVQNNEFYMWQYFLEKEYIYNSDRDLLQRFIDPAPFSKFYIESDTESPGQTGIWIGWQIVKSYMAYNQVSLPEMMATPPIDIFNRSKYKPKK